MTDEPVTTPTPPPPGVPDEPTMAALRRRAGELEIDGRSTMEREDLVDAIVRAEAANASTAAAAAETEAAAAGISHVASDEDIKPSTPAQIGRPDLVDVAEQRAADREATMDVIGTPTTTQED